jgi:hypothetical protein
LMPGIPVFVTARHVLERVSPRYIESSLDAARQWQIRPDWQVAPYQRWRFVEVLDFSGQSLDVVFAILPRIGNVPLDVEVQAILLEMQDFGVRPEVPFLFRQFGGSDGAGALGSPQSGRISAVDDTYITLPAPGMVFQYKGTSGGFLLTPSHCEAGQWFSRGIVTCYESADNRQTLRALSFHALLEGTLSRSRRFRLQPIDATELQKPIARRACKMKGGEIGKRDGGE